MIDALGYVVASLANRSSAVAAADDREARSRAHDASHLERAACKRRRLEEPHRPVPEDRFGPLNLLAVERSGLRTNVERHRAVRNRGCIHVGADRCIERIGDDDIDGQEQLDVAITCFLQDRSRKRQFVVLDLARRGLLALSRQERVGHGASDAEHIDHIEQRFDDVDLVRNLRATKDRDVRFFRTIE